VYGLTCTERDLTVHTHRVCGHDGLKGSGANGVAALSLWAVQFTAR